MQWFSRKDKNVKYTIKDGQLADFDRAIKRVKISSLSDEADYIRGIASTLPDGSRLHRLADALASIQAAVDALEVEEG